MDSSEAQKRHGRSLSHCVFPRRDWRRSLIKPFLSSKKCPSSKKTTCIARRDRKTVAHVILPGAFKHRLEGIASVKKYKSVYADGKITIDAVISVSWFKL